MAKGPGTVLPDPDGIAERWGLAPLPPPSDRLDPEPWSLQYVEHLLRALEQFDD